MAKKPKKEAVEIVTPNQKLQMAGKELTLNMITEAGEIRPTTGVLPSAPLFLHRSPYLIWHRFST